MSEVEILRIDVPAKQVKTVMDCVAQERPLYLFLNRIHYVTILCSPANLKEIAVGHLLSERIVKSVEEIKEVKIEEEGVCRVRLKPEIDLQSRLTSTKTYSRIILSACGSGTSYHPTPRLAKIRSDLTVSAEVLLNCVNRLNSIATTFRMTGGVHAAAIFAKDGALLTSAEDIGRHNAVDKAIGAAALGKIDFANCFLTLTGRLTADIVLKAARIGLPIIASLSAAIDSGINVAKDANLTLVGFVRGKRMNVYNCGERILL